MSKGESWSGGEKEGAADVTALLGGASEMDGIRIMMWLFLEAVGAGG
jgi:hypothetical protein